MPEHGSLVDSGQEARAEVVGTPLGQSWQIVMKPGKF